MSSIIYRFAKADTKKKEVLTLYKFEQTVDSTYKVPIDIYTEHIYLKSGNSSFKRTIGKSKDSIVYESLYIK